MDKIHSLNINVAPAGVFGFGRDRAIGDQNSLPATNGDIASVGGPKATGGNGCAGPDRHRLPSGQRNVAAWACILCRADCSAENSDWGTVGQRSGQQDGVCPRNCDISAATDGTRAAINLGTVTEHQRSSTDRDPSGGTA